MTSTSRVRIAGCFPPEKRLKIKWREQMSFCCPEIAHEAATAITIVDNMPLLGSRHYLTVLVPKGMQTQYNVATLVRYVSGAIEFIASLRWSTKHPSIRLNIHLFLSSHVKRWYPRPNQTNVVTPCDINSGETSFDSNHRRTIRIWRREDIHKVLLHELLHAYDWDRLIPQSPSNHLESEAFIEWLACLIHCLLQGSERFVKNLRRETRHSMRLARLLVTHRCDSSKSCTAERYYITLKSQMLKHVPTIWHWLIHSRSEDEARRNWPDMIDHIRTSEPIRSLPSFQTQIPREGYSFALVTRQLDLTSIH